MSSTMAAESSTAAGSIREIYKNGWLKKMPLTEKRAGPFAKPIKPEKLWVVFCVHDEKEPYLEYYENRRSAYSHSPACSFNLTECLHISPTIIIQEDDHEFAVTLGTQVIRLAAPTQELMNEWIDVLGNKLRELGVLQPKDNVYSKEPTSPASTSTEFPDNILPTRSDNIPNISLARDPNSPLPPIPPLHLSTDNSSHTVTYVRNSPFMPSTPTAIQSAPPDSSQRHGSNVFTFDIVNSALYETTATPSSNEISTDYEPIFQAGVIEPANLRRRSESEITNRFPIVLSHRLNSNQRPQSLNSARELRQNTSNRNLNITEERSNSPLPPTEDGPPPYELLPIQSQAAATQAVTTPTMSLKQAQVQLLSKEIAHRGGVRLLLRKKDSIGAIALVDCFGAIWVAGWKQKEHPLLHNTFHIGDKIMTVAGRPVSTVQEAQKAIKQQPLVVEFIVQRLPHGRPLAIKREFEGQDLGIVREGRTAEIKEVTVDGLVARHGLPFKSPTIDGNSLCNWMLTEVNGRPLNLFFRENEVYERLNAVGRDISILVQPCQLVCSIRKQLKALRSYKEYIVQ